MRLRPRALASGALLAACALLAAGIPSGAHAQTYRDVDLDGALQSLPHEMTAEEELIRDQIGAGARITPPPSAQPVRAHAEFERMKGVFVRYPLGISVAIVAEMSEDALIYCIVTAGQQGQAQSAFQNGGVNMSHVVWFNAYTNSYWVRDYGPWFVYDANEEIGIIDVVYNRPRPDDDEIPEEFAAYMGWDLYQPDLIHTGGNWMEDGRDRAASTTLVYEENPGKTPAQIAQIVEDFLGIDTYHVRPDVNGQYIEHIDCWGKYLAPDKVLIRQVPVTHSQYDEIEAVVDYFEGQPSAYGWPYEVVRVWTPGNEPYTNSLILNQKVLVPVMGGSHPDAQALNAYRAAMPGYEVLGFTGSWESTDALHCRAKGVPDADLLYVWSVPRLDTDYNGLPYPISAEIIDHSQAGLIADQLRVYWRVGASGPFSHAPLSPAGGNAFSGAIPSQPPLSVIQYYVSASDYSGRTETWPLVGSAGPFQFTVLGDPQIVVDAATDTRLVFEGIGPNPIVSQATIRFRLAQPSAAALRIYDADGRLVRRLMEGDLAAGSHAIGWNRTDDARRPVAPGVYFFSLEGAGEGGVSGRVIVVR